MKQKVILFIFIGIIVGGVIGIKAATVIQSNQVIYKENKTVDVALNEMYDELYVGKEKLAESITNKGIETTSDNTLSEMADNINDIDLGGNINSLLKTLLWENSNQSATSFPPQTITFNDDYTNYDYLIIKFWRAFDNDTTIYYSLLPTSLFPSSSAYRFSGREFTTSYSSTIKITSKGVITLSACGPTGSNGTQYVYAVPLAIYGCNL